MLIEQTHLANRERESSFEREDSLMSSQIKENNMVPISHQNQGILEIFNDPPKGMKMFCGKLLDLKFQHVVETRFKLQMFNDNESVYSSHYSVVSDQQGVDEPSRTEYLRQRGENLLNITMAYSMIYPINEEEAESGSSEEETQKHYFFKRFF